MATTDRPHISSWRIYLKAIIFRNWQGSRPSARGTAGQACWPTVCCWLSKMNHFLLFVFKQSPVQWLDTGNSLCHVALAREDGPKSFRHGKQRRRNATRLAVKGGAHAESPTLRCHVNRATTERSTTFAK